MREVLVAKLDVMDGDPDFEPEVGSRDLLCPATGQRFTVDDREGDDEKEHSLGWPERVAQLSLGAGSDEDEPWLGAPATGDQRSWAHGGRDDREEEDDFEQSISGSQSCAWGHGIDLEASDEDAGEGSLGWPEGMDQRSLGVGSDELEPSLGSVEGWYGDQIHWGQDGGVRDDREWECEDEGAQVDAEPDGDGDGTPNRVWEIAGREMWKVDGTEHEPIDPDELPETLEASFCRAGVLGG